MSLRPNSTRPLDTWPATGLLAGLLAGLAACTEDPIQYGEDSSGGTTADDGGSGDESDSGPDDSAGDGDGDGDGDDDGDGDGDGDGDVVPPLADYRLTGPYAVTDSSASVTVPNGCVMGHAIFVPTPTSTPEGQSVPWATVMLAHGFTRTIEDMAPFARHLASWGLRVVTVPLCTNSPSGVDHTRNGEAIVQLALQVAPGGAIYMGFSAGGLGTFLADGSDPNSRGYVGLDPVDSGGLAGPAAGSVGTPAFFAIAEPGTCNSNGNFAGAINGITGARALRVTGASHFDVEGSSCAPGDFGCSFCAPTEPERHELFLLLATSAALEIAEPAGNADAWWTPGTVQYEGLAASGAIEPAP